MAVVPNNYSLPHGQFAIIQSKKLIMPTFRQPTLDELCEAIVEFNRRFPRPNIGDLKISEPFNLSQIHQIDWPNSQLPGVYAFLNQANVITYIGKASCGRSLGDRLRTHFRVGPDDTRVPGSSGKADSATFGVTIGIPKVQWFEAVAIEEYLIAHLLPPQNNMGLRGDGGRFWQSVAALR